MIFNNMEFPEILGLQSICYVIIYIIVFSYTRLKRKLDIIIKKYMLSRRAHKAFRNADCRTLEEQDELVVNEDKCTVCMENFESRDDVITLPCYHVFHKACIEQWLLKWRTCPLCKHNTLTSLGLELTSDERRFWQSNIVSPDVGYDELPDMYDENEPEDSTDEDAPPTNDENRRPDQRECGCIMGHRHYE